MKKVFMTLLVSVIVLNMLFALDMPPKREFRGVWLSTVGNIDWPKSKYDSDAKKQADLKAYLQKMKDTGLNAVLLQVRCACDAMYDSPYEPWSYWFSGTQGQGPSVDWDPLAFAVEEAHKLGLELHAWVNPYRAVKTPSMISDPDYISDEHVTVTHPEWILKFDDIHILNPGLPDVRDYITKILMDIVNRYDIDGLHMDDYFYPYSRIENEDAQTYAIYSRGIANVHDWRRDNINLLVEMVNDSINIVKPWVKWGISPFGVWKPGVPSGISAMDAFNILYCDPIAWLQDKTVDYITPQLYWPFGGGQDYGTLVPWWAYQAKIYGRHFYPGHGLFHVYDADWDVNEIPNQIQLNRDTKYCDGSVYFTAHSFDRNAKGVIDIMRTNYYYDPALWPVMTWKDSIAPAAPANALLVVNGDGSKSITWDAPAYSDPADSGYAYVVYSAPYPLDDHRDMPNVKDIQINQFHSYEDSDPGMYYYGITALDRNKLESPVAVIDYPFVHPLYPAYAESSAPKDPTIEWAEKTGATQYTFELNTSNDFTTPLYQYEISGTSQSLALVYQTDYFWRVKANNTDYWSPVWTFKTELPPQVDVVMPVAYHEGVALNPLLKWNSFEDASSFELQVSTNSAMTDLIVNETSLTDTSYQMGSLEYATRYYWRVRSNKYDRWTDILRFKTREEFIGTVWERASIAQTYPAFLDTNLEATGLALGRYQDQDILLVLQTKGDSVNVNAVSTETGDDMAFTLNMTGVSGGVHVLRDIEYSEDGILYAANCADIGESFKVYQWTDPTSAPRVVYEAANVAYRLGDHITVDGRQDNGSVTLYAPGAMSDKMLKLEWNEVSDNFTATQLTLERGNSSNPGMAVSPRNGELYVTSNDYYLRHFTATGGNINWMKDNLNLPKNANAIAAFTCNNKTYIAGYVKDSESAHVIDVTSGVRTALKAGSTYRMGTNDNEQLLGDVEVMDNGDGTFTIFVLGNRNGVGAYTFDALSAMVSVADPDIVQTFELGQNYPNPFNPVTAIPYRLDKDMYVDIRIYDLSGKRVATLYEGYRAAGSYEARFDASGLSSGQYICRLTSGNKTMTRKLLLLK